MDEYDTLWRQAYASFEGHAAPFRRSDRNAQAALTRIAVKGLGFTFDSTNSQIRRERWSFEQLKQLKTGHNGRNDCQIEPLILIEWEGRTVVIDGNHRLNGWVAGNDGRSRQVVIISPGPDWPRPLKAAVADFRPDDDARR
jgi:hypothetical protein